MMEAEADIELGPIEVGISADLGGLQAATAALKQAVEAIKPRRTDTHRQLSVAGTTNGGTATLDWVETPPVGRYWIIVRSAVTTGTPATAYTGVVVRLYRGVAAEPFSLVDVGNIIPNVGFYDDEQLTAQPSDKLSIYVDLASDVEVPIVATLDVIELEIGYEGV